MKAEDFLHKLKRVKRCGRGWVALCPAHNDHRASFSITNGDRGLLMHCFRGCSIEAIKSALGIFKEYHEPFVPYVARPRLPDPQIDFEAMFGKWEAETDYHFVDGFASTLGVDLDSLQAIGCAWAGNAWAFPMKDAGEKTIGIRLRDSSGSKFAVKGSKQGMFLPSKYPYCVDDATLYIVEGPTDLAAAMTIGLYPIGRASCLGQEEMIAKYVRGQRARRVVIISDNDSPGLQGARKLQAALRMRSCIYAPPTKDLRDFVECGGTANLIESSIRDLVWKQAA